MHRLTLGVLILFAALVAVSSAADGTHAHSPQLPPLKGESPVTLLAGYQHRSERGIDSKVGRIWKDNGPSIDYEIGLFASNQAEAYAERYPKLPMIRLDTQYTLRPFLVVMDEKRDAMIVTSDVGNFSAHNVRSRLHVAEVLTMIKTFEFKGQTGR